MEKEQELSVILTKLDFHSISHLEAKKLILNLFNVGASTTVKELHEALTNLLQATDDEGWNCDGEDWEEQEQARKALANTPSEYLR